MGQTPAIEAEGLVKNYGKTQALAGLDLVVPAGTVYGLLGPERRGQDHRGPRLRHAAAPGRGPGAGPGPRRG